MKIRLLFSIVITFLAFFVNGCGFMYSNYTYASKDSTIYTKDLYGVINKDSSKTVFYNNSGKVLNIKNSIFGKSETGEFIVVGIEQVKTITTSENKTLSPSELSNELIAKVELNDGNKYSFDNNYGMLIIDKKVVLGYNTNKEPIAAFLDKVDSLETEEANGFGRIFEFGLVFIGLLGAALIAIIIAASTGSISVAGH